MAIFARIIGIIKKKAIKETAIVTIGSLINGASLFLLNIILARIIDKNSFGAFSLSLLALNTAGEISDFGLNSGLLRFAPYYISSNQREKLHQLIKTIWSWRVSLSAILTAGGIVFAYPISKYIFGQQLITQYLMFVSLGVGGVIMLGFTVTYLQASQKFFASAVTQSLKGLMRLVLFGIAAFSGLRSLYVFLGIYIVVPWVLYIFNFRYLPADFRKIIIDSEVKRQLHSQLAKFSFWLTMTSLIAILAGKLDQIMISHYLGLAEVAVFTVAWQLIQVFPVIYGAAISVLMPKMSGVQTKNDLIIFIKRISKYALMTAFIIGIFLYPSKFLILLLFGEKYREAMPLFLLLSYGMLFNIISIPFSIGVTLYNKTHLTTVSAVIQLILVLLCNFIFIPRYGIMGVGYTTVISLFTQFLWNVFFSLYLMKNHDLKVV